MIGIQEIGVYIPKERISNYDLKEKFAIDDAFIENKIGVKSVSRKSEEDNTSDLGVKAFQALQNKLDFDVDDIECLFVVTQNPDYNLPHTSAIIHGKLELSEDCACFDISLGCSGFVYGVSVIESFMERNDLKKGVLITVDPYSKIINPEDKNTSLLFGDGATATLFSTNPKFKSGKFSFGTSGKGYEGLICTDHSLSMSGHAVFNFAAKKIPLDVKKTLEKNKIKIEVVDSFLIHQGSKFIVDTIRKRLRIDKEKVPFSIQDYGNTVSSSIPILLEEVLSDKTKKTLFITGFGVGLSWASTVLKRIE